MIDVCKTVFGTPDIVGFYVGSAQEFSDISDLNSSDNVSLLSGSVVNA